MVGIGYPGSFALGQACVLNAVAVAGHPRFRARIGYPIWSHFGENIERIESVSSAAELHWQNHS